MRLLEFDKGWWNCFNSYTNDIINAMPYSQIPSAVLEGGGVTKEEALYVLNKTSFLSGKAINVVSEYIIKLDN